MLLSDSTLKTLERDLLRKARRRVGSGDGLDRDAVQQVLCWLCELSADRLNAIANLDAYAARMLRSAMRKAIADNRGKALEREPKPTATPLAFRSVGEDDGELDSGSGEQLSAADTCQAFDQSERLELAVRDAEATLNSKQRKRFFQLLEALPHIEQRLAEKLGFTPRSTIEDFVRFAACCARMLTPRRIRILGAALEGKTQAQIASRLNLSEALISTEIKAIGALFKQDSRNPDDDPPGGGGKGRGPPYGWSFPLTIYPKEYAIMRIIFSPQIIGFVRGLMAAAAVPEPDDEAREFGATIIDVLPGHPRVLLEAIAECTYVVGALHFSLGPPTVLSWHWRSDGERDTRRVRAGIPAAGAQPLSSEDRAILAVRRAAKVRQPALEALLGRGAFTGSVHRDDLWRGSSWRRCRPIATGSSDSDTRLVATVLN